MAKSIGWNVERVLPVAACLEMDDLPFIILVLAKEIIIPSTVLIGALALGTFLLWSSAQIIGRWLTTISVVTLLAIAILPVPNWLARPLETRFPPVRQLPDSVAGIILLGGAFEAGFTPDWSQPQVNDHAGRLFAFMSLARQIPQAKLAFSGGAGSPQTESDKARILFASIGMDTDKIIFEDRSRNTCENAIYTAKLLKPREQQTWILVTSAMDMPRAVGAFKKAGFQKVLPYPADYITDTGASIDFVPTLGRNLNRLDHAVHEWLGLLAYRLLSCTDTLFPGP